MSKELTATTASGDGILIEVFEDTGAVCVVLGDGYRMDIDSESAFDLADALMVIANSMESHMGEE